MYWDPEEIADIVEVVHNTGGLLSSGWEVRDHPEVPPTEAQRDAILDRAGWERTGPWIIDGDHAEAPVVSFA
jgi:hypothetical protein